MFQGDFLASATSEISNLAEAPLALPGTNRAVWVLLNIPKPNFAEIQCAELKRGAEPRRASHSGSMSAHPKSQFT